VPVHVLLNLELVPEGEGNEGGERKGEVGEGAEVQGRAEKGASGQGGVSRSGGGGGGGGVAEGGNAGGGGKEKQDAWVNLRAWQGAGLAVGDMGPHLLLVPPQTTDMEVGVVRLPQPELARRVQATWSFGVGDPSARHSESVRYGLPYAGTRGRHVCQGFGGKYSHYGKLEYSVDFDLPVGYQVRVAGVASLFSGSLWCADDYRHSRVKADD
jgi:hypothetical protein